MMTQRKREYIQPHSLLANRMLSTTPLNTAQAAKALGISKSTLLRMFRTGKIQDVGRDRNEWRVFHPRDIERIKQILEPVK